MPTPSQINALSIKRCQETVIGSCPDDTAGCCGIVSCALCVQVHDDYGVLLDGDLAPYADGSYYASSYGHSFSGVWSVNYEGDCVFTVTIDEDTYAEQVINHTCYDSPCRAASGSVSVPEGTLSWSVSEPIPIARRTVDGCLAEFCGTCGCAPTKVCVSITTGSCNNAVIFPFSGTLNDCGEATTVEYAFSVECGGDTYAGVIRLERGYYTDACLLIFALDGSDDVSVSTGCEIEGTATIETYAGDVMIEVTESPCEVCVPLGTYCCDCRFSNLGYAEGTYLGGDAACAADPGSGTVTFVPTRDMLEADWKWTASDCTHGWGVAIRIAPSPTCSAVDLNMNVVTVQRSPVDDAHPDVNGDIAANCEWYLVAFDHNMNFLGIYYEYSICCEDIDQGPASSFLKWVSFPGVATQFGSSYDWKFYNPENIALYGPGC